MHKQIQKKQEEKNQPQNSKGSSQNKTEHDSTLEFFDQRPKTSFQNIVQEKADTNARSLKLTSFQEKANVSTKTNQPVQLKKFLERDAPIQEKSNSSQQQENKTGLPDGLKSGIESLSGMAMDDVKVHRNSKEPERLQAHAFAQGTAIHVGPGQEQHLPHEAWHVVQQKQGRVKPTVQRAEKVAINDDASLEREATQMGNKAVKNSSSPQTLTKRVPSASAPAQLISKEDEISLRLGKPLDKRQKETVRNRVALNDQIKGFNPSSLKKGSAAPATGPQAVNVASPAASVSTPAASTKEAVVRNSDQLKDIASMPGMSSVLKGVTKSQAEKDNHGNASMLDKVKNTAKSTAAFSGAQVSEGAKDAKAKGSSIWGSMKAGASSMWSKTKSFFGGGPKGEPKAAKPVNPDQPSMTSRVVDTGLNVLGNAAIGGAKSFANSTVGNVGDIGVNAVRTVKSGKDAYDAHGIKKGREEEMKGKVGGDRDLGASLAAATRNQHLGQAVVSGGKLAVGVGKIAKTVATSGADSLLDTGVDFLEGAAKTAGKAAIGGGLTSLMGGGGEKALSEREDLNLGETLAGQSATETEKLQEYLAIMNKKAELTPEDMKKMASARSALLKEGFDRSAGYGKRKEANSKRNQAGSLDSTTLSEKFSLEKEAIQHGKAANEMRDGVNTGANTLSPSDFKARGKDLKTVKALGGDLRSSDESFTTNLVENEGKSHNRMTLATEKITELEQKAKKGLNKKTGNRFFG